MRFRSALVLLAMGSLLISGAALAKKPTEFNAPQQMSEEELQAAKERSKNRLNGYDEKMEEKPKEFPWRAAGLAALCFMVAAPFALRSFKTTSKEIAASAGRDRAAAD